MVFNLNYKGKVISSGTGLWTLSFADLASAVIESRLKLKKISKEKQAFILSMKQNPYSISMLLAALAEEIPIAIYSQDMTVSEIESRRSLVKSGISINESDFGHEFNLGESNLHPDAIMILFTSGSTGKPKAVQLSQKNISSNIFSIGKSLHFENVKKQHLFLDLSYSFGLLGQLLPAIQFGVETVFHKNPFELKVLLESGRLDGMISGVPSQLKQIVTFAKTRNYDVSEVVSAGAFLPYDLRQELVDKFPNARVTSNYGQTEASPRILCFGNEDVSFLKNGVGRFVDGWVGRISPEGELQVNGPQVMLGYLDDLKSTEDKIQDGWLFTGDYGSIDSSGLVSISGRKDDLVKIAGERISLLEIENELKHGLGVSECLVFPTTAASGELVIALVITNKDLNLDTSKMRSKISTLLSKQKIPKIIYLAQHLPQTANGKIKRKPTETEISEWMIL